MPTNVPLARRFPVSTRSQAGWWLRIGSSRLSSLFLLFCFFYIVAAASHAGFMGKWAFRDEWQRVQANTALATGTTQRSVSVEAFLEGRAIRPWSYRKLLPLLANAVEDSFPELTQTVSQSHVLQAISPSNIFTRAGSADRPEIRLRYIFLYYISFASLLMTLFFLRRILLDFGISQGASILAPSAFLLTFPYFQTLGGYNYDNLELMFLSISVIFAMRGQIWALIVLSPIATLNKETFILFLPALYPLLRQKLSRKDACVTIAVAVGVASVLEYGVRLFLVDATGPQIDFQLFQNLALYIRATTYFDLELTYGLVGPSQMSLVTLLAILLLVLRSWSMCGASMKRHIFIACALNLPLYVLFCKAGELRNLSLLSVGLVMLIALAADRLFERSDRVPPSHLDGTPIPVHEP